MILKLNFNIFNIDYINIIKKIINNKYKLSIKNCIFLHILKKKERIKKKKKMQNFKFQQII